MEEKNKIRGKKSFLKKTLAGALACTMVVSASAGLLTGCGAGADGKDGADGNTWKVETGAPTATTEGKVGDMYLDRATYNLY